MTMLRATAGLCLLMAACASPPSPARVPATFASAPAPGQKLAGYGTSAWRTTGTVWGIAYRGDQVLVAANGLLVFDRATGERRSVLALSPTRPDGMDQVIDDLGTAFNMPERQGHVLGVLPLVGDERRVLVMSRDELMLMDWDQRKRLASTRAAGEGGDPLVASQDGRTVALRSGTDTAAVWRPDSGERIELGTFDRVMSLAMDPEGKTVYVADRAGVTRIELAPGLPRTFVKNRAAHQVLDTDGDALVVGAYGRILWLDGKTLAVRATCQVGEQVWRLDLGPGHQVAYTTGRDVGVCAPDGSVRHVARRFTDYGPYAVAWSPGGEEIAVGSDARLELYTARTGQDRANVGHGSGIVAVAIEPGGKRVATADEEGQVELWTLASGKPVRQVRPPDGAAIQGLVWTPAGLVVAEREGEVWLDDGKGQPAWTYRTAGRFPSAMALSPDGQRLAISRGEATPTGVDVIDVASGRRLTSLDTERSYELAWRQSGLWSRTGKGLVVIDQDRAQVGALLPLPDVVHFAVDAGGTRAVTCEQSGDCQLRSLPEGTVLRHASLTRHRVSAVAIAPDGSWAAVGSQGGAVVLWRLSEDAPEKTWRHAAGRVELAISPDGQTLVTGGEDSTADVWKGL